MITVEIEGKGQIAEFPDGTPQEVIDSAIKRDYFTPTKTAEEAPQKQPVTKDTPWVDVLKESASNIPSSAVEFAKNTTQAVIHPMNTLGAISDIIEGGTQGALSKNYQPTTQDAIDKQKKYEAFKQALVDRYTNPKNTIATDPIGSIADLSTLLTGGGSMLAKAPGIVGKGGAMLKTAGSAIDPINASVAAVKPVVGLGGKVASGTLGFTTGAGKESIKKAYEAGVKAIPEFRQTLRDMPLEGLREEAKTSLQSIKDARAADYRTRLNEISQNTTELNFKPVKDQTQKLMVAYNIKRNPDGTLDFSRSTLDSNAVQDIEVVINTIDDWGSKAGDLTPTGMDILKRKLDDFYSESKNSRGFVTSLKTKVKETVVDQVPEYATMLKNYEKTTNQITEIEKTLSLGTKASADTGLRKLLSALKDNNEFRGSLISKLDEANNGQLATKLAAYNLSSWTPNSLMGKGIDIAAMGSIFYGLSPQVGIAISTASPRVVGELANLLGKSVRHSEVIKRLAPLGVRQASTQIGRYTQPQMVK